MFVVLSSVQITFCQKWQNDWLTFLTEFIEYIVYMCLLSSVQITFRQKWQDDRLTYLHKLTMGDMKGKVFLLLKENIV